MECAERLVDILKNAKMTVTTVESCTGGMVAAAVTSVPGSSAVLRQAYVTYCDEAKHELAGVRRKTLKRYTAVSKETAKEMASGGAKRAKADCCIAVTGYAGPDTGGGEPVGLVYIGCRVKKKIKVKKCFFEGDRTQIRGQAAEQALLLLVKMLGKV